MAHRWQDVAIDGPGWGKPGQQPDSPLGIPAVRVPAASLWRLTISRRASPFWQNLLRISASRAAQPRTISGDFNTGRHRLDEQRQTFTCTALLGRLTTMGYRDAYRQRHPHGRARSWFSHAGSGFCIDHAFVSPLLSGRVEAAWYEQSPREEGLSDHAPMLIKPNPPAAQMTRRAQ